MDEPDNEAETLVQDIMTTLVLTVGTGVNVKDAARLMAKRAHGCLLVVEGDRAIGIITERDIVRQVVAEGADPSKIRVTDIMSTPLVTVPQTATALEAAERMSLFEIRRIVVVHEDGALAGLLTAGDLAKWLAKLKNFADPALNAIARTKKSGTGGPYR